MSTCRSCGAQIIWAHTTGGKLIPLDAERSDRGNIDLRLGTAHYVTPDINMPLRFVSHFATCVNAAGHRRPRVNAKAGR